MSELAEVELRVQEQPEVPNPVTGELVDLRDLTAVAGAVEQVRDAERMLYLFRRDVLTAAVRLHSQRQGTKTLHAGTVDLVLGGGTKIEWDGEGLVGGLLAAGLPQERIDELVKWEPKVNARVAAQLAAANPAYAEAIDAARTIEPASWYVTVKR